MIILDYYVPRASMIIIDKSFIISYLDYQDIAYDQAYNNSFHQKVEIS